MSCVLYFELWNLIFVHFLLILAVSLRKISKSDWDQEVRKRHQALQQGYLYTVYLYPDKKEEWAVTETVGSSLGPSSEVYWLSSEEC